MHFFKKEEKIYKKERGKGGGLYMHIMEEKRAGLVYALYAAKSEARRLAIPAAGRSGCPGSVYTFCRQQAAGLPWVYILCRRAGA